MLLQYTATKYSISSWQKNEEKNKPDSHWEWVNIFIQGIKEENGLDDHVIHSINIELYLGSAVTMPQTELSLL